MEQPGAQIEEATVTHPGVAMERDGAEGLQIIQEAVWEAGEQVVV